MLTQVLVDAFKERVGKFQERAKSPQGLLVSFAKQVDHETEEGYRHYDLLIYAPMNYVGVYFRERADVIPLEGLEYDEESEDTYVKSGYDYKRSETEWKCLGYHDSGWPEGIQNFFDSHEKTITGFASGSYLQVVDVAQYTLPER